MTDIKIHRNLWYTRRDTVVRGPYPEHQVSRYILLGRIRETDEVRCEGGVWQALAECAWLVPDVMKLPEGEEKQQKLLMARMREDERQPGDRRERPPRPPQDLIDRRSGKERRAPEPEALLRHRELRFKVSHSRSQRSRLYRYPLAISLVVLAGFGLSYVLNLMQPEPVPVDCAASPRDGVNWENCNQSGMSAPDAHLVGANLSNARLDEANLSNAHLAGANLTYSSADSSRLRHADLSHANLQGATLRNADLGYALLNQANLSYVNLSGANIEGADFSGAVLDNAIWVDEQPCVPGSVGACHRERVKTSTR